LKSSITITEVGIDVGLDTVREHNVDLSIAVEISDRDSITGTRNVGSVCELKPPITASQENDKIRGFTNHQIGKPVTVHVGHGNRVRRANDIILPVTKRCVAGTEEQADGIVENTINPKIRGRDIELPIDIESLRAIAPGPLPTEDSFGR